MIIDSGTKRKLREMNASELLEAFERLDERTVMPLSHAEVVGPAVDNAYGGYTDAKIQRLVKRTGLRYPQADLRTIDLAEERGLDRGVLAGLDAGNYLGQRLNVAFQGATGSGKSFLLCALVKSACRGRYRACYARMPDLAEQVEAAALKPGGPAKLVRKYSAYTLLAIDEWLVDKPDERFGRFLLELMELRFRQRQHRVRHPVGDQGMAQPSRRRHHRRRHPRPHRAQHGMDRHRQVQHEATARAVHARILTIEGASGLDPVRHWPSLAITVALKGNNQRP